MSIFNAIFERYGNQLNNPEKKGLFLLGAFAQIVIDIQQVERGSKPFLKHILSLKIDQSAACGLLPKMMNKLHQYDRFDQAKGKLAYEISHLLLSTNHKWKLSIDEINYYFSCGMVMSKEVRDVLYPKGREKE